jgi:hypothetical protein
MFQDRPWLQDFEALPPEKQAEVIDFIQFLRSRKPQASHQTPHDSAPAILATSTSGRKGSFLERAQDLIGIVDDAPSDLATHPKHMQGFGE